MIFLAHIYKSKAFMCQGESEKYHDPADRPKKLLFQGEKKRFRVGEFERTRTGHSLTVN